MVTQPSEADYRNPATHDYIEKYLKGVASVPTEDRMRLLRLIENMTMGTAAVATCRVHARRRLAAGTAHYDRPSVQHGNEEGTGEEDRADQVNQRHFCRSAVPVTALRFHVKSGVCLTGTQEQHSRRTENSTQKEAA